MASWALCGFLLVFCLGILLILGLVFKPLKYIYVLGASCMPRCLPSHMSPCWGLRLVFWRDLLVVVFSTVFSAHQAKYHHRKHFVSSHLHPCVEPHAITASPYFSIRILNPSHLCWLFILVAIVTSVRQKTIHISGVIWPKRFPS